MCNKNLMLKSSLKVNGPLEFIEALVFFEEGGKIFILNLIFRRVG